MEKGAIRFHGLTAELLERPDLLRSIFLEGAAAAEGGEDDGDGKATPLPRSPIDDPRARRCHANGGERRVVLETRGITRRFAGHHRGRRRVDPAARGRDPRHHRPERRGQDHAVRPHLGVPRPRLGLDHARRARRHPAAAADVAPSSGWRARSRTPGSSARSPCTRRSASRSTGRIQRLGPDPGDALLPERRARRAAARQARRRAHRDDGSRRLPRQVRVRPLHREPAHRRPRVPDRDRAEGDPVRRAVVGHRAARDRGARSAARCASATSPARASCSSSTTCRSSARVSDRIIACDLGRVVVEGDWETVRNDPHVVASYLGSTREVIERSGPSSRVLEVVEGARP